MTNTTIYRAKRIITQDSILPYATHVAVVGDRIAAVGGEELVHQFDVKSVDARFGSKTILPGFVEGHCHATEGCMWEHLYIGYFDRRAPDGGVCKGVTSRDEIVSLLSRRLSESTRPEKLIAWGYDPIYFSASDRLTRHDLDRVSLEIPIVVFHASFHILAVNMRLLDVSDLANKENLSGVVRDSSGEPTGELQGLVARHLALTAISWERYSEMAKSESLWNFARSARQAGVTTATDLANTLQSSAVSNILDVTEANDYPMRIVFALLGNSENPKDACGKIDELKKLNTNKVKFGPLKLVVDGSIQGFTARILEPGYIGEKPNGLWYMDPTELDAVLKQYNDHGVQIHAHVNGDEAIDSMIGSIENVFSENFREDNRWTLQHFQLAHENHFERAAKLGLCVNLFANHIFYWGDIHKSVTVGAERAARMNSGAMAKRHAVPFSIHSDAPITPLAPLFTAWCAVNRLTASGEILGEMHAISVEDALHAITLGAAYTLKLDHEIGSITAGKFADFAILEEDPLEVDKKNLKDIPIWGTMLGGTIFPNEPVEKH